MKIGGAVYLTGHFQLDNNKSVNDLINSAKGLSNDLLGNNAIYTEVIRVLITNLFQLI